MAGLAFVAQTAEIATGTSKKTLLQIVAAANHRVKISEISISFDGISNTDAPILMNAARNTSAGTMSSLTLRKWDEDDDETLQTTARHTATAEPTEGNIIMSENVHPQGGGYTWQAPYGREIIVNGGDRLGINVTAGVGVNAVARVMGEE